VPAGHGSHINVVVLRREPYMQGSKQSSGWSDPAGDRLPDAHAAHTADPTPREYEFGGHCTHAASPVGLYSPASHGMQPDEVSWCPGKQLLAARRQFKRKRR
jgi:hypothetical protein